jgi:exonuclease III
MTHNLKVVCWNVNSVLDSVHNFQINNFLNSSHSPDMFLLTEAKIENNFYLQYNSHNYNILSFPFSRRSSGLIFFISIMNIVIIYHFQLMIKNH